MKRIAQTISIILGPFIWPITLIAIILRSGLINQKALILLPIVLFFQVIIPYVYIFQAYKRKKISDLNITKREERYRVMIVTLFSFLLSLAFIFFLGNLLILKLSVLAFIILAANTFITFFWKISLHMALNIVFVLIINYLYHWQLPILYACLPLVFWSRLYLKKHTVLQLLGALVINGGIVLSFIFFVL